MQLAKVRRDCQDVQMEDGTPLPLLMCHFVASFACNVLARSRDRRLLPQWTNLLWRLMLRIGPKARIWFGKMMASHGFVREVFLECPLPDVRAAMLSVAVHTFRWLYESEANALREFAAKTPHKGPRSTQAPPKAEFANSGSVVFEQETKNVGQLESNKSPLLLDIWATLLELLPVAQQPELHQQLQHFLLLFQEFLLMGPETLAWVHQTGGLGSLLEFALQGDVGGGEALAAALRRAQIWYKPNPLRAAGLETSSVTEVSLVAPADLISSNSDGHGIGPACSSTEPIEAASFERQLRGDSVTDAIELGPLWASLAMLLESSPGSVRQHSEENDALLRRLVRIGGATQASCAPASKLLQLLCRGDLALSQGAVCRICERVDESDGRALRAALRMGTALVDLDDSLAQPRGVFLLKSLLHVAKNNRKNFRTMHPVVHYIVKWCRRRPLLPQWLLSDVGASSFGAGHYRWLETWLKECANGAVEPWNSWQAGSYPGQYSAAPTYRRFEYSQGTESGGTSEGTHDPAGNARWAWCNDMLPLVRKIVRGDSLPKGELLLNGRDSDDDTLAGPTLPLERRSTMLAPPKSLAGSAGQSSPVTLSKVQMINALVAAATTRLQHHPTMSVPMAW